MTTTPETKNVNLRLDARLSDAIDVRCKDVGLSRNEWINRALSWVIQSLPAGISPADAHQAALRAPQDVAGQRQVDMGLR